MYKRQTQDSSITFRRSENLNLNISGNVDYAGTMQLDQASGGYGPVSYTHLDVYKRQVPAW